MIDYGDNGTGGDGKSTMCIENHSTITDEDIGIAVFPKNI